MDSPYQQSVESAALGLEDVALRYIGHMQDWDEEVRAASISCDALQDQLDSLRKVINDIRSISYSLKKAMLLPLVDYVDECENYYESLCFQHEKPYVPFSSFFDNAVKDTSNDEETSPCWVYFIESETTHFVKIGITINLNRRLKALESASGDKFIINKTLKCSKVCNARCIEGFLHDQFSIYRHHPNGRSTEWFDNVITPKVTVFFEMGESELLRMANLRTEEYRNSLERSVKIRGIV